MGLNKEQLSATIRTILDTQALIQDNPAQAREALANDLADAIDLYVKGASVVTNAYQAVQVAPSTGTGITSAPGTGYLV